MLYAAAVVKQVRNFAFAASCLSSAGDLADVCY